MTIKDHIKGNASFSYYRDNALWYRTSETNLLFPVPIDDIGSSTFLATEKSMLFMRWIRKYLVSLENA